MKSKCRYSLVSYFFCSAICMWDSPMWLCVAVLSFSLLYSIPLCEHTTGYSSILWLMDIWVVFSSELLWIVLLWTFLHCLLVKIIYAFLIVELSTHFSWVYSEGWRSWVVRYCVSFRRYYQFPKNGCNIYMQYMKFSLLQILIIT